MQAFFQGGADSVQVTRKILEYHERRRAAGWTPRAATGARFLFKPEEGVKLLAPVVRGVKIYCLAANSKSHLAEQGKPTPKQPYVFTRFFNSLVGPSEALLLNPVGAFPDVELELALVIGLRGKHIPAAKAIDYVAGYTIALDMGYRDLQYPRKGRSIGRWARGSTERWRSARGWSRRKRSANPTLSAWSSRSGARSASSATLRTTSSASPRSWPTSPRGSRSSRGTSSPSAAWAAPPASSSARSPAS